jgi:hypothetical protein
MGGTWTFPDMNEPVWTMDKRLPPITRWAILTAIIAVIVWMITFLLDKRSHNCHKKRCKSLHTRLRSVERRIDQHVPPYHPETSSPSSPSSP